MTFALRSLIALIGMLCCGPFADADELFEAIEFECRGDAGYFYAAQVRTFNAPPKSENKNRKFLSGLEGLEFETNERGFPELVSDNSDDGVIATCHLSQQIPLSQSEGWASMNIEIRRVAWHPPNQGECGAASHVPIEIRANGAVIAYWPSSRDLCFSGLHADSTTLGAIEVSLPGSPSLSLSRFPRSSYPKAEE